MSRISIKSAVAFIWKPAAFGVALGLYGNWQYHRGFDTGADSAICAFAVGLYGPSFIRTQDACRRITNHDWVVEGFGRHGKGLGA